MNIGDNIYEFPSSIKFGNKLSYDQPLDQFQWKEDENGIVAKLKIAKLQPEQFNDISIRTIETFEPTTITLKFGNKLDTWTILNQLNFNLIHKLFMLKWEVHFECDFLDELGNLKTADGRGLSNEIIEVRTLYKKKILIQVWSESEKLEAIVYDNERFGDIKNYLRKKYELDI
jgi:hypothetical protein